jgi:hypothetical protein
VARLVRADRRLGLEHSNPRALMAPGQLACDCKADDAGPNYDRVAF